MLVPRCSPYIGVAHDIHYHREISGCTIRRRTKSVTCTTEDQGLGKSGLATRFSELLCNCGQMPGFCLLRWNSQPSRLSEQRTINNSSIRSLIGTCRLAGLVFPFGLKIKR